MTPVARCRAAAAVARSREAAAAVARCWEAAAAAPGAGRAWGRFRAFCTSSAGDASRGESEICARSETVSGSGSAKCLTEHQLKMVSLEKELCDMKCSFEHQAKYNNFALGLIATLVASLPVIAQSLIERHNVLDEKQKTLQKKHKSLKSRVRQMEMQLSQDKERTAQKEGKGKTAETAEDTAAEEVGKTGEVKTTAGDKTAEEDGGKTGEVKTTAEDKTAAAE